MTTSEQFALVLRTIYPGAAEAHAARAALRSIEEQVEFHKAAAAQNRDAYSRLFEQVERQGQNIQALYRQKRSIEEQYEVLKSSEAQAWNKAQFETDRANGLQEQYEAADAALQWLADNHPAGLVAMPTDIYRRLRLPVTSNPATCPECEGRGVKGGHGDLRDCPACTVEQ